MPGQIAILNLNSIITLTCGCSVQMEKIFLLIGAQKTNNEPIVCPFHGVEHQFSKDSEWVTFAEGLYRHNQSSDPNPFTSYYPFAPTQ